MYQIRWSHVKFSRIPIWCFLINAPKSIIHSLVKNILCFESELAMSRYYKHPKMHHSFPHSKKDISTDVTYIAVFSVQYT